MEKHHATVLWAIILSEGSHIFCCVLPTVFSIASLLAGFGLIGAMPGVFVEVHEGLHAWEVPMILISGGVLVLGWGLHLYSQRIDCHDTGCGHGPCAPKKSKTLIFLKFATALFVINIAVWLVFHRGMQIFTPAPAAVEQHHHDHAH